MSDTEKNKRKCPHCGRLLDSWIPPGHTGWTELLVCNNNECEYFKDSYRSMQDDGGGHRACRYAEEVDCNYNPIALLSWHPSILCDEE